MHRNAALLHKQHRTDSCESRLYISFCANSYSIVYFTHGEIFFLFTGALLRPNYRMPFWDLTCWACQCVNKVNLKKGEAEEECGTCAAVLQPLHSKWHLIETSESPAVTQRELWNWEDLNAVFCFSFLFPLMDGRPYTWMQRRGGFTSGSQRRWPGEFMSFLDSTTFHSLFFLYPHTCGTACC